MRFSIRDLLWVTLVVAMGLGWWATNAKRLEAVGQAHRLRAQLVRAGESGDLRIHGIRDGFPIKSLLDVDWSVLDEPLVEP
jgi:hypothetical protein